MAVPQNVMSPLSPKIYVKCKNGLIIGLVSINATRKSAAMETRSSPSGFISGLNYEGLDTPLVVIFFPVLYLFTT